MQFESYGYILLTNNHSNIQSKDKEKLGATIKTIGFNILYKNMVLTTTNLTH